MPDRQTPRVTAHALRSEADWWRVRDFIIHTYPLTATGQNWEHRRWEGYRFHNDKPIPIRRFREIVRIWERGGEIVGVANPEDGGDVHLQIHPAFRHLEFEMLAWGEEHLSVPTEDGTARKIHTFAFGYDTLRRRTLTERGWECLDAGWVARRMRLGAIDPPPVPEIDGYILRPTSAGDPDLTQRMADVINAGFGRTSHTAKEYANFMAKAPVFSHDLNLVAELPDGSFAAHVGCNFDEQNRMGFYEPVCTHPEHRRKGLAQALMVEGLHRFKALGAIDVYVETGDDPAANALYDSMGFTEAYRGNVWRKIW